MIYTDENFFSQVGAEVQRPEQIAIDGNWKQSRSGSTQCAKERHIEGNFNCLLCR